MFCVRFCFKNRAILWDLVNFVIPYAWGLPLRLEAYQYDRVLFFLPISFNFYLPHFLNVPHTSQVITLFLILNQKQKQTKKKTLPFSWFCFFLFFIASSSSSSSSSSIFFLQHLHDLICWKLSQTLIIIIKKLSLIMLHLPLSHMWYSLLYHNARLFYYLNRLLSIRPLLHTLPKKSNCYNVSSLHSLNSPLLHPSRNVFNRISDIKIKKTPVCYECSLSINHSFSNFSANSPLSPLPLKASITLFSLQASLSPF